MGCEQSMWAQRKTERSEEKSDERWTGVAENDRAGAECGVGGRGAWSGDHIKRFESRSDILPLALFRSHGCEAQLAWKCLFTSSFFREALLTSKLGQTDLVLICYQGSSVGLCVQDHNFLRALCTGYHLCHRVQHPDTQTNKHTDNI